MAGLLDVIQQAVDDFGVIPFMESMETCDLKGNGNAFHFVCDL
jgi:hypothetical protein